MEHSDTNACPGRDRVFLITGGEAHIGAAATAFSDGGEVKARVQTIPGHREEELAARLAKMAAERLGVAVTVVIGIHFDSLTAKEIRQLVKHVSDRMQEKIAHLETRMF